jgi:hypothetical protein
MIIVVLIAIILIIWLQYPQIKNTDENKKLYLKIFDTIKIPIIVICFIIIIYQMYEMNNNSDFTKLNAYMSVPKF